MIWYALASLTPAVLLTLAFVFGGPWPLLALVSISALVFVVDRIPHGLPDAGTTGRGLNLTLAAVHFGLLPLGIWALGVDDTLTTAGKVVVFIGLGLYFGQISNSNAHELIHTASRWPRRLGAAVYSSLLYGHHVSAHLRVHHVHAATDADPNSAPLGEGFYSYAARAWRGEFLAGLRADTQQRARRAEPSHLPHPYVYYLTGSAATLGAAGLIAGWEGILVLLAIAFYAQMQLLLSDYVQHYGLRRDVRPDGRPEPIGARHSWNAPAWYSSAMMLNAPRHSDHHMHPARAFPSLRIEPATMPILPRSLPVMAVLALVPPVWRRVMDRRVARWQS
tara:strand:- start:88 stop:1092 length:1005 start_codon:yes stop_codon:yes gene_type:complete